MFGDMAHTLLKMMGTSGTVPGAILGKDVAGALALGLPIGWARWRGKRPGGALVGIHASLAIGGFVLVLTVLALA